MHESEKGLASVKSLLTGSEINENNIRLFSLHTFQLIRFLAATKKTRLASLDLQ